MQQICRLEPNYRSISGIGGTRLRRQKPDRFLNGEYRHSFRRVQIAGWLYDHVIVIAIITVR